MLLASVTTQSMHFAHSLHVLTQAHSLLPQMPSGHLLCARRCHGEQEENLCPPAARRLLGGGRATRHNRVKPATQQASRAAAAPRPQRTIRQVPQQPSEGRTCARWGAAGKLVGRGCHLCQSWQATEELWLLGTLGVSARWGERVQGCGLRGGRGGWLAQRPQSGPVWDEPGFEPWRLP